MAMALEYALADADMSTRDLHGLVTGVSLYEHRFMQAHCLATAIGLLPGEDVVVKTLDTGGASPITGLLEATEMIEREHIDVVAVVVGDRVKSIATEEFLRLADASCPTDLPSPVLPHGYDRVARWQMDTYGLQRAQLAMVPVLMNRLAQRHPHALRPRALSLDEVLASRPIGPAAVTTLYECAKRADGGAAVIVASSHWLETNGYRADAGVVVLGGAEGAGPLTPPPVIDETMFSCETATRLPYNMTQLAPEDIDIFMLYDCFPICFIRALEAVGLAQRGTGGQYVEDLCTATATPDFPPEVCPINTHGGLLGYGAPWEVPAGYSLIEAYEQLTGRAGERQIPHARRALVYGNGGIFSASAVAILGRSI
jgi:acetyl-CoA acetyltransferase